MKKLKNGHYFVNIDCTEKYQITDPPKVWVSIFPSVNGNGISVPVIMKKLKNCHHFVNIDHMEKCQIIDPPKFGSPVFRGQWKWNISVSHYEKNEKWLPFHKYWTYRKMSNYWPPKSFGLQFSKCQSKQNISVLYILQRIHYNLLRVPCVPKYYNNNNNNNFISFKHNLFSCTTIAMPLLITVIFELFERGWSWSKVSLSAVAVDHPSKCIMRTTFSV